MAINSVIMTGRTTADVEVKTTQNGKSYAQFRLAVSQNLKGNNDCYFIPCVAWNGLAETIAKYVAKGSLVGIQGQLTSSDYSDKDGNKRTSYQVLVKDISFEDVKKPTTTDDAADLTASEEFPF